MPVDQSPPAAAAATADAGTVLLRRDGQPPLRLKAAMMLVAAQPLPSGQVAEIALWRRRRGAGFAVSATLPGPGGPRQQAWSVATAEDAMARIEALTEPVAATPPARNPSGEGRRRARRAPPPDAADAAAQLARRAVAREEARILGHLASQLLARLDQEFTRP
jgi:hypothetical protein